MGTILHTTYHVSCVNSRYRIQSAHGDALLSGNYTVVSINLTTFPKTSAR